jgi:hypothetical protein
LSGSLTFSNPNAAIAYGADLNGSLGSATSVGGIYLMNGANSTTSAVNAIKFTPSTGTWTSGSIEIWGNP